MSFRIQCTMGAFLLGCSGFAAGAAPSYNYVEPGHEDAHVVHEGETVYDNKSFGLAASWEVVNHLAVLAEVKRTEQYNGDFTTFKLGADLHWSIFRNTDFNTRVAYNFRTKKIAEGGFGLRNRTSDRLELNAFAGVGALEKHRSTDANGLVWKLGGRFYVTSALSLGYDHLQMVLGDDRGSMNRLSIRYDFAGER